MARSPAAHAGSALPARAAGASSPRCWPCSLAPVDRRSRRRTRARAKPAASGPATLRTRPWSASAVAALQSTERDGSPRSRVPNSDERQRIRSEDARRLLVEGIPIGNLALEHALRDVRVLALVALERQREERRAQSPRTRSRRSRSARSAPGARWRRKFQTCIRGRVGARPGAATAPRLHSRIARAIVARRGAAARSQDGWRVAFTGRPRRGILRACAGRLTASIALAACFLAFGAVGLVTRRTPARRRRARARRSHPRRGDPGPARRAAPRRSPSSATRSPRP